MRSGWETYLKKAKEIAYELHITSPSTQFEMKRGRKRKTFFDEEEDCQLDDPQEYFKNSVFYATIDNIVSQLESRFKEIEEIMKTFECVLKLKSLSDEGIHDAGAELISKYPEDLTTKLVEESRHFKCIFQATFPQTYTDNSPEKKSLPLCILNDIYKLKLETVFPEMCVGIRLFCILPVTVASGERGFSSLQLTKTYFQSTMSQEKLNNLAILSIEHKLAAKLQYEDIIQDFVSSKIRRIKKMPSLSSGSWDLSVNNDQIAGPKIKKC